MQRQRGLTLLELLVVLAIIGLAMTGVGLSLRDPVETQLEREAQRLVAVLEAARAQSRTSGVALIWQATPEGYSLGPSPASLAFPVKKETWYASGTQVTLSATAPDRVVLGPEPILTPTRITLSLATTHGTVPAPTISVGTEGLRPFQIVP